MGKPLYGKRRWLTLSFTAATTEDLDFLLFKPENRVRIRNACVMFARAPAFASGITVTVESDNGSTETIICGYDTTDGYTATPHDLTFAAVSKVVPVGSWAQVHVVNLEATTASGTIIVEVEDIPG